MCMYRTKRHIQGNKWRLLFKKGIIRVFVFSLLFIQLSAPLALVTPAVAQYDTGTDGDYMIICTADGLKVIRIEDGAEMPDNTTEAEHCLSCRLALLGFTLPETTDLFTGLVIYPSEGSLVEPDSWIIPQGNIVATNSARAPPHFS